MIEVDEIRMKKEKKNKTNMRNNMIVISFEWVQTTHNNQKKKK